MGLSPAVFLRSYRLARAMNIIRGETAENLSDISSAVGYKHLSHFSREFKAFTGVTPSEYKNSCSNL
jgi:AraC-like DNA-binding protein